MSTLAEAAADAQRRKDQEAKYRGVGGESNEQAVNDVAGSSGIGRLLDSNANNQGAKDFGASQDAAIKNSGEFHNPGAAEFGGDAGMGDWYKNVQLGDSHNNDGLQNSAAGAAAFGLAQMKGQRGPQSVENGSLVGREAGGRSGQMDAMGMARTAAMGGAPSEAAFQTTQGMNTLMGANATAMGGARGLSALNGAGLGGSAIGAAATGVAQQGGLGRSREMGEALGQYGTLAGNVRGQDLSRLAQNSQNSNFNADLNDKWSLGQGQNAVNAGKLGNSLDLTDQARYGASMQPAEMQFGADQESQGWQAGANTDKSAIQYAKDQAKRKSDHDLYMGIGGSVVGAAGTMAGGPMGGAAASAGWQAANSGGGYP